MELAYSEMLFAEDLLAGTLTIRSVASSSWKIFKSRWIVLGFGAIVLVLIDHFGRHRLGVLPIEHTTSSFWHPRLRTLIALFTEPLYLSFLMLVAFEATAVAHTSTSASCGRIVTSYGRAVGTYLARFGMMDLLLVVQGAFFAFAGVASWEWIPRLVFHFAMFLGLCVGLYLNLRLCLALPMVVLGKSSVGKALRDSWGLMKGRTLQLLLVGLIVTSPAIGLYAIKAWALPAIVGHPVIVAMSMPLDWAVRWFTVPGYLVFFIYAWALVPELRIEREEWGHA